MLKSSTLQVLSMSRLGGAGAVAPLVTDIPLSSVEVINESILYLLGYFIYFRFLKQLRFCSNDRKKVAKVVETNQHGISGRTMAQNGK